MASRNVIVKGNSIFLKIHNDWYVYDTRTEPLGSGAMGTVYIGHSYSNPHIKVAIKRVAAQYQDIPSIRQRALMEGNLRFGHANLIRMIGCCEYDEFTHTGPIWIVSHLIQGIRMDEHVQNLQKTKRPIRNIIEAIYPVLDALDYLHGGNIVHLDIKPSNIMCENGHHIILLDLGIASSDSAKVTGFIGTPGYAAPEQFLDEGLFGSFAVNATTDLYQVGITLYELLTQTNPYDAPTLQQSMYLHKTLLLPEHGTLPSPILETLRKATQPLQSKRFQSAIQMKDALKNAVLQYETELNAPWWKKLLKS